MGSVAKGGRWFAVEGKSSERLQFFGVLEMVGCYVGLVEGWDMLNAKKAAAGLGVAPKTALPSSLVVAPKTAEPSSLGVAPSKSVMHSNHSVDQLRREVKNMQQLAVAN